MKEKKNYDRLMDEIIEEEKERDRKPRLLLHACCAPCSTAVLESLEQYFAITIFFYNPNIENESEFNRRAEECQKFIKKTGLPIHCIVSDYIHQEFLDIAKGLEREPERGERCTACFQLRLKETACFGEMWNKQHPNEPFDYFCTSLSISPLKNAELLNCLGEEIGKQHGIRFLPSDFKKKGRYLRSVELSKQYELYRQDYCGCEFSKAESLRRNKEKEENR